MKRGEIWTISGGGDYTGKPRPAVIVQDDNFDATASVTLCAFTSDPTEAPLFRVRIQPSDMNGLRSESTLMVDKLTTVRRERVGSFIGRLDDEDLLRLNRAILVFLGLAGSPRT
ncbi:MAG: type II toxin-antitoxin system PemK/MazF family toxin [Gemmatimonadetes bacterium]|nr:type II toxin-antitoxin system PemK/MazF family toxin [Gemmatimonadota bacterium]